MEAHTQFDIQQAFVATNKDVKKIWKILEDNGMVVTATIKCTDGLVRHFQDSEMLSQYENPKRASIAALEISGRSHEPYSTAEVSLGARYSAPVFVSIRGEESCVSKIRTDLTDTVDGMKPWYSRISMVDLFYFWTPIFMVLMLLLQIMAPSNTPTPAVPFKKALSILAATVTLIGLIGGMIWGVSWLRKRFFPIATFAIGQGLARHHYHEQVRWAVMVGFIVSLAASIVATILFAF